MKTTQRTAGWYHVMEAVTVMIWGTTFVATKVLIKYGLSPVDILFYRFLLAYICIWFFSPRVLLAKSWQDELRFVGLGLCGGSLYFVAENTALGMTACFQCIVDYLYDSYSDCTVGTLFL